MELSNDQKAILRLLAQRGAAGYDDLTALMGMSAAEVHEKAKAAAAQLEAEGIPAPSIPAPGSAEPEAPAPPAEPEPVAPEPVAPAPPKAAKAPAAAPAAPKKAPGPPRDASPGHPGGSRPKFALPSSGGARAALAAGVVVVVALIVVLIVSGGGDSGDTTTTTTASSESTSGSESAANTATNTKLTQAVLSPVDGGDAQGLATFGRVKNSLALQIEAEGLEPTAKGHSYTIWLYESPQKMLPLASTVVPKNGKIGAQVQVPTEVLTYLAKETFDQLDVSLTSDATLKASLAKATKEKKAPLYTGTDVLRGTITGPIIGAANKASSGE
jgi:hypothetical protein